MNETKVGMSVGLARRESLLKNQNLILILIIFLVSVVVGSVNNQFFTLTNAFAIFQQVSVLGILTMCMTLLLISGGIDLSIGMIMALCGVCVSKIIMSGGSVYLAVIVGIAVGVLCGLLNGVIISKSKSMPLIITLGMSSVYFGIALMVSGGKFMNFQGKFEFIGRTKFFGVFPSTLIFLFVTVIVAFILLNYTKYGRRIVAIGGNEENAYLSGIPIDRYKIITYGISGLLAGVASIVLVSRLDSIVASAGTGYELAALMAAIIGGVTFEGGRGTVGGAFLGVIMTGLISNAMTILSVNSYLQTAVTGSIIVIAVVLSNMGKHRKK
jgi:ribose/xylose/arabinose/galactoside ABC-type transport system permease subunit